MYFFLSHLSFVDFCYSSIVTPKLLGNLVMADKSILYTSCMLQYFLSCTAVVTESFLLAMMAYDHFVAICNPLLYTVVMSQRLCALLVSGSYLWGMFGPLVLLCYALQLSFSGHTVINHFFCEYIALIAVSSSNTHIPHLLLFAWGWNFSLLVLVTWPLNGNVSFLSESEDCVIHQEKFLRRLINSVPPWQTPHTTMINL